MCSSSQMRPCHIPSESFSLQCCFWWRFTLKELFPTCSISVWFLSGMCAPFLSQVQTVFQDRDTCLTGVGFLGKGTCFGSPDLWHSFYRSTLLRRCLLIFHFMPITWNQRNTGEVQLALVGRGNPNHKCASDTLMNECTWVHRIIARRRELESGWEAAAVQ